jgi:putative phosphoesterase
LKIAILADIHGNSAALRATLQDARDSGAERLIILGDTVGYYYRADEVLEELNSWQHIAIRGNHDRYLAQAQSDDAIFDDYHRKYGSGLRIASRTLSRSQIDWLAGLPDRATASIDGITFELCHGSPNERDKYVYPDASAEVIDACVLDNRDFVLMGHTHRPMIVCVRSTCLLNPGSVGQARDFGGFASWCLFETATRAIQFRRTPYNVEDLINEVRATDPHLPELAAVLVRNSRFRSETQ